MQPPAPAAPLCSTNPNLQLNFPRTDYINADGSPGPKAQPDHDEAQRELAFLAKIKPRSAAGGAAACVAAGAAAAGASKKQRNKQWGSGSSSAAAASMLRPAEAAEPTISSRRAATAVTAGAVQGPGGEATTEASSQRGAVHCPSPALLFHLHAVPAGQMQPLTPLLPEPLKKNPFVVLQGVRMAASCTMSL